MNGIFHMSGFKGWNHFSYHDCFNECHSRNICRRLDIRNGDIPWSPLLPDLALATFFMGYLKSKVYQGKRHTIPELIQAMQHKVAAIPATMLTNVIRKSAIVCMTVLMLKDIIYQECFFIINNFPSVATNCFQFIPISAKLTECHPFQIRSFCLANPLYTSVFISI